MTLGLNGVGIKNFIDGIEDDARAMIKEIATTSIWSNISPDNLWAMSYLERVVLNEAVKEKIDYLYGKKGVARGGAFR